MTGCLLGFGFKYVMLLLLLPLGRGFVTKFGCVVTCHCVVCAFGFHNPVEIVSQLENHALSARTIDVLPVEMLDAVSKSDTVLSDKFGKLTVDVCVVDVGRFVVYDCCGGRRFVFDGRMTSVPPL